MTSGAECRVSNEKMAPQLQRVFLIQSFQIYFHGYSMKWGELPLPRKG